MASSFDPRVSPAYVAGLIDGEGQVTIATKRSKKHAAVVAVTMVDRAPLDVLASTYGGRVYTLTSKNDNWKTPYRWQVSDQLAENVLRDVRPFLLVKGPQADLCLQLREQKMQGGRATPERQAAKDEIFSSRAGLVTKIRELNRRGV